MSMMQLLALESEPPYLGTTLLVIAGGGGGAAGAEPSAGAGSGGAGGYIAQNFAFDTGINYTVVIGAGGGAGSTTANGSNGSNSVFANLTAIGGGGGGYGGSSSGGLNGGSGGGAGYGRDSNQGPLLGGQPTAGQGYKGGDNHQAPLGYCAAYPTNPNCTARKPGSGGGGAGGEGGYQNGIGGVGASSDITGSVITRAAGGPGPTSYSSTITAVNGAANTGNGGSAKNAGAGGSGVVILNYRSSWNFTNPGGGLTYSTTTVNNRKVTTITAGAGTVQFT